MSAAGHVTLYDAAVRLYRNDSKQEVRYHVSLEEYACKLLNTKRENIVIDVADVYPVNKNALSGVAAIFHALCLSMRVDPQMIHFPYQTFRKDLRDSFVAQSFQNIQSLGSPRLKPKTLFEINVSLYCHCKMPYVKEPMIECSYCKSWFHQRCETGDFESHQWKCKDCLRRAQNVSPPNTRKRVTFNLQCSPIKSRKRT